MSMRTSVKIQFGGWKGSLANSLNTDTDYEKIPSLLKTLYTYKGKRYIKRIEVEHNLECQAKYLDFESYR